MTDFLHHFRLRWSFILILILPILSSFAASPDYLIIKGKVRDFKEMNPTDSIGTHPHFDTKKPCGTLLNGAYTIQSDIDTTNAADGNLFEGDNRGPKLIDPLDTALGECFTPTERFSDWYQDKGPDINRSFRIELRFQLDTLTGLYRYKSDYFFPIDSNASFSKFKPTDPDPFGHLQKGNLDGVDMKNHNYGFTMEFHSTFQYQKGKSQAFVFEGDDDVWVFMNGKRVLDLGGVHTTQGDTLDLDTLADSLGLTDGGIYPLDFFFAERHTALSKCVITTSLELKETTPSVAMPTGSPLAEGRLKPGWVRLETVTPDATIHYTLDGKLPDSTDAEAGDSIFVTPGIKVRAIAYRAGWQTSEVLTLETTPQVPAAAPVAGPIEEGTLVIGKIGITTSTPDAKIYYTLDESQPDSTKTLYTDSIEIPVNVTLKAIAYAANWKPSAVLVIHSNPIASIQGIYRVRSAGLRQGRILLPAGNKPLHVRIFDRGGKTLLTLTSLPNGDHGPRILEWDGKDGRGNKAAPGIYFWSLEGNAKPRATGRLSPPR